MPLSVLILKVDRLYADLLQRPLSLIDSAVTCSWVSRVRDAESALMAHAYSLLITDLEALDGDVLDLLARATQPERKAGRILVVTPRREPHLLATLRELVIDGLFDSATEGLERLPAAIRAVLAGSGYWSPSIREIFAQPTAATLALRVLTPTERLVFAAIGDGSDDETTAACLGMKRSAVQAVRRNLHEKLRIQQRGELIRVAVEYGFVGYTPAGLSRFGFGLLLAHYQARSKRPLPLSPELAATYPEAALAAARRRQ